MHAIRRAVLPPALALAILPVLTVGPAHGQSYFAGIAVHAGSLGVGADFAYQVNELFGVRGGIDFLPPGVDFPIEDVDYDARLPSPQYRGLLDFYPGGSSFRLSGGILVSPEHLKVSATPNEPVTINETEYAPEDVGTLTGELRNRDVAPYVGIGYGKTATAVFGFFIDLGVAFHGRPELGLEAEGPIADVPSFQANLEADREEFEDRISWARAFPVLSIGFSFGVL